MATGFNSREIEKFDVEEFSEFLQQDFDEDVAEAFKKNKINGALFILMNETQLASIVPAIGDIIRLKQLQTSIATVNKDISSPVITNTVSKLQLTITYLTLQISSTSPSTTPSSSSWHVNFVVPEKFSTATNNGLKSGNRLEITNRMRDEIINSLSGSILTYTMRPTPEQYTAICVKLVKRYPILEDTYGDGEIKIVSKYNACTYI